MKWCGPNLTGSGLKAHCCCNNNKVLASINGREILEHLGNRHISKVNSVPLTSVSKLIWYWAKFQQRRRPISCDSSASFSVYPRSHLRLLRNSTHALWRTHSHKSLYTHNTLGSHFTTWSRESFLPLSCLPQWTRIPSDTPQADSELSPVWSPLNITSFTTTSCKGATPNDSPCCDKHCFYSKTPLSNPGLDQNYRNNFFLY